MSLAAATAALERDPAVPFERLAAAVAAAGYRLEAGRPAVGVAPFVLGVATAVGLLAFYLGVITLAQGWGHATQQLAKDGWLTLAILAGFGAQVGLFVHLRALHAHAAGGGVAASTAAMLACCAHHLVDVLPVVGLAGAAALLGTYKTQFLWVGVAANALGVGYLVRHVLRARRPGALPGHPLRRSRSAVGQDADDVVFDSVVTVGDRARGASPTIPGDPAQIHWSFEDPEAAEGSEAERSAVFRRTRDAIQHRVRLFVNAQVRPGG